LIDTYFDILTFYKKLTVYIVPMLMGCFSMQLRLLEEPKNTDVLSNIQKGLRETILGKVFLLIMVM